MTQSCMWKKMLFGFFYGKQHLNQHSVVIKKAKNSNVIAPYKNDGIP
jgi:hypothetical protein